MSEIFINKARCFGSKGVFQIEHIFDQNAPSQHSVASQPEQVRRQTLGVEVSPVSNRNADYSQKTNLELSVPELMRLSAVFLGFAPDSEFKRPNKTLSFTRQHQRIYVAASSLNGHAALPIDMEHSAIIGTFLLSHLAFALNAPQEAILASIKGAFALQRTPS